MSVDPAKVQELHEAVATAPHYQPKQSNGEQQTQQPKRAIIMRSGQSIDEGSAGYLWGRRIPVGGLTVVFSRPGRGKSTLGADLTGRVTTGKAWPDDAPCGKGTVFYLHGEGTAASLRDRMKLAGADPSRYYLIGRAEGGEDDSPMIDLAEDVPLIEAELTDDVRLLIVDTLDSMFPSMRMIDNANIRRCLWPLQDLAERRKLAVVVFAHTNKGGYADPLDRLSGGRAIGGAARAIWYLGKIDPHAEAHYMALVKANDFKPGPTLAYEIVGVHEDQPGAIRWGGEADVSAWDLDRPPKPSEAGSKAEDCADWLRDRLADGPVKIAEIKRDASTMDYGDHVMRKAREAIGVIAKAAKGSGPPPTFYYLMPDQEVPDLTPVKPEALSDP